MGQSQGGGGLAAAAIIGAAAVAATLGARFLRGGEKKAETVQSAASTPIKPLKTVAPRNRTPSGHDGSGSTTSSAATRCALLSDLQTDPGLAEQGGSWDGSPSQGARPLLRRRQAYPG